MKRYPNNHYIYHGDTLNVPYGDKSKEEIKRLLINTLDFFKEKECTFVIVACGTMSSIVDQELIDSYRPYFNLIDILTPTINFLNKCIYKRIGIIGTTRTIEENKFSSVNKELVLKATPSFVPMIEDGSYKRKKDKIEAELEYFKDKVDCIVLGCTHFKHFTKALREIFGENIEFLDGALGTARNIKRIADNNNFVSEGSFKITYYESGKMIRNAERIRFLDSVLKRLEIID